MKRFLHYCLFFFIFIANIASAEDIQLGTGTSLEYKLPVNMYYNYSMTQQIYTAAEIGREGYITSISFLYDYSDAFTMQGVQVYLQHVRPNLSNLSGYSGFIQVLSLRANIRVGFTNDPPLRQHLG